MSVVVGVHGVSLRKLRRPEMAASWLAHLSDGLQLASGREGSPPTFSLIFFDDLITPDAAGRTVAKGGDVTSAGEALDDDEVPAFAAAVAELLTASELAEAASLPPAKGYTRAPGPLTHVLAALDRRFGPAAAAWLILEFKQLRRYLLDPVVKAGVDERVRAGVADDCRVLFGHSLGSLVAFEFLRQNADHQLDLFLTAGSPLGLRMVRDRIADVAAGEQAWAVPANVRRWVNLRDTHDPITCAGDLSTWWPAVEDRHVSNGSDAHSADRYLSQPYLGAAILAAIPQLTHG